MKANHLKQIIVLTSCAVALVGCAQQPTQSRNVPPGTTSPTTSASAKSATVLAYFPTGKSGGSGLLVQKVALAPTLAGQSSGYSYKVSNLTDAPLPDVAVQDRVNGTSSTIDSDPRPTISDQGIATWKLGSLAAKESKIITIKGLPMDENSLITFNYSQPDYSHNDRALGLIK